MFSILLWRIICFFAVVCLKSGLAEEEPQEETLELQALCNLVAALNISSSSPSDDWSCVNNGFENYCDWNGILCTGSIVTSIDLKQRGLAGEYGHSRIYCVPF